MNITMNSTCTLCNGDGYLVVLVDQWKSYLNWMNDPTEDKLHSNDDFPYFLKNLASFVTVTTGKNIVSMQCTLCGGKKTKSTTLTIDDLKSLLVNQ